MNDDTLHGAQAWHDSPEDLVVRRLSHTTADIWWACSDPDLPPMPTYSGRQQRARGALMDGFIDVLQAERVSPRATEAERLASRERLAAAFQRYVSPALDLDASQTAFVVSHPLAELGLAFCQRARQFDPALRLEEMVQASRNAVVMHNIQTLLGLPVEITPSILAYSLIYPYSDNLVDDPRIPARHKHGFGRRLERRLAGGAPLPLGARENAIWRLVALIEGQYPRDTYPQVYGSLQAIHRAQNRSVGLLHSHASPYEVDVLGISMEKGGTSVLADGYLVAGSLTSEQAEFLFRLGAFLQLGDDLQDVADNLEDGLLTIFTQTTRRWPLDGLTTRTLHFGQAVLAGVDCFDAPGLEPLKTLMVVATRLLLIEAAAHARRFYTRSYVRRLETHSPVRFSRLEGLRRRLNHEQTLWASLLETIVSQAIET